MLASSSRFIAVPITFALAVLAGCSAGAPVEPVVVAPPAEVPVEVPVGAPVGVPPPIVDEPRASLADFVAGRQVHRFALGPFVAPATDELVRAQAAGQLRFRNESTTMFEVVDFATGDIGALRIEFGGEEVGELPTAKTVRGIGVRPVATVDAAAALERLGVARVELQAVARWRGGALWRTNHPGLMLAMPATAVESDELAGAAEFELLRFPDFAATRGALDWIAWTDVVAWATAGRLDWLEPAMDGIAAASRQGAEPLVTSALTAAITAGGPDADSVGVSRAWQQVAAAWRCAERLAPAEHELDPRWQAALNARGSSLAARMRDLAGAANADAALLEGAWLERLAEDVERLCIRTTPHTEDDESIADVLVVLGHVAAEIDAAVGRGGFTLEQPLGMAPAIAFTAAQRATAVFATWNREAEDLRARLLEDALTRSLARGMRARAAELWLAHDPSIASGTPRTWLARLTASDRQQAELALLELLATLVPFVPAADPDGERMHAAVEALFETGVLARHHRLMPGSREDLATFAASLGVRPVVPLLHALDDRLEVQYSTRDVAVAAEDTVLAANPALDQWRDTVSRREADIGLVDDAIRRRAGIAPSDPGFDTWLRLNPGAGPLLAELLELRRQAEASAWVERSFPPPATVPKRVRTQYEITEVRQDWTGHASREAALLGDGVFVSMPLTVQIRAGGYVRRRDTPLSEAVDEWRSANAVAGDALVELDRQTKQALPQLVRDFVAVRTGAYLAAGRDGGWSDEEVAAEARAIARILPLPSTDPAELSKLGKPVPALEAALATQVALGSGPRQVATYVPSVPPLQRLKLLREFESVWGETDLGAGHRVRFSADLTQIVGRDEAGVPFAFDLQRREMRGEDAALAAWQASVETEGRFVTVTWHREPPTTLPDYSPMKFRWVHPNRPDSFLSIEPVVRETTSRGLQSELPTLQARVCEYGRLPGGAIEAFTVAILEPGGRVADGGMLLLGRLAWTSTVFDDRSSAVDLWDALTGTRLFRFDDADHVFVLEHLDVVVSVHRMRRDGAEHRMVRVWAVDGG